MAVLIEENDLDVEELLEDFDDEAWDDEAWDDEAWDDEAWDDEALAEALPRRYRRRYSGRTRPQPRWRSPAVRRPGPVSGLKGGSIRTRAGTANIRFPKPVATTASVDSRLKQVTSDLTKKINAVEVSAKAAIKKVDQAEDKSTSILNKKVNELEGKIAQGQMLAFLPMLMTKPSQITEVKVGKPPEGSQLTLAENQVIPVAETTYKKDDNMGMLLALMAMSGGLGGGTGDSSTMLVLALALGGGFGGSGK